MLTCKEMLDFLMSYLDGDLPPEQRAEFERHLTVCPPCVNYLQQYEQTIRLGRDSCRNDEAPQAGDIPDDLVNAILRSRSPKDP